MPAHEMSLLPYSAVVVTGGSSGIGKSFISHIGNVKREVLICNLSRRRPEAIADKLNLRHIECDLADADRRRAAVAEILDLLDTAAPAGPVLLINNAGFGAYGRFPHPSADEQLGMIDLNIAAGVDLTAQLLPVLKTRGGAIMNVASTAAFQPTPFLATYGATKAFVLHWSLGLREELRGSGVHVMAVCPGPTSTEFFRRAGLQQGSVPDAFGQTSEAVVAEAMAALARGRGHVVTGWKNKVLTFVSSKVPLTWVGPISRRVLERYRLKASGGGSG